MKMWSSQTTGELQLNPGMSIFQAMFSVSLQVSGRAGSSAMLPALNPRNFGHCCAAATGVRVSHSVKPVVIVATSLIVVSFAQARD